MQNENFNEEKTILEGLKFAIGVECDECGHINSGDASQCEECGYVFPEQPEEKQFSYKQEDKTTKDSDVDDEKAYRSGMKAIPIEESKNLIMLQETIEGAEAGEITPQEYRQNVTKVLNVALTGVELFKTKVFTDNIDKLPPEQKTLATESARLFDLYAQGCRRMLDFDGSELTPAAEGFEMVENALTEMDRIQKQAIEFAHEEREKKLQEQ